MSGDSRDASFISMIRAVRQGLEEVRSVISLYSPNVRASFLELDRLTSQIEEIISRGQLGAERDRARNFQRTSTAALRRMLELMEKERGGDK